MLQACHYRVTDAWHTRLSRGPPFVLFHAPFHFAGHQHAEISSALAAASLASYSLPRFTTAFVSTKGAAPTYDGNFYYDPATTQFAMWYANAKGEIVQGPVAVDGDITSLLFESGDPRDGKPGQMRVVLTRKSDDLYIWSLYNLTRDPLKPIFSLTYRRVP